MRTTTIGYGDFHPFANIVHFTNRLLMEAEEHEKLIVAIDYDNTVFDTHDMGYDFEPLFAMLRCLRDKIYLIGWTASKPERYAEIRETFREHGLYLDAINENAPWIENRGPKIYANLYIDDRAGLLNAWFALNALITAYGLGNPFGVEESRYGE